MTVTLLLILAGLGGAAVIVAGSLRRRGPASRPCLRCDGTGRVRYTAWHQASCPMCHGSGRRPPRGDGEP